jgi:serine/tyrosine/threonine adenylyltransferase
MLALGPYAFMDIFDPMHVCNHTDQEGRYAYKVTFLKPSLLLCHFNTVIVSAPARNDVSALSNAAALHAHCINSLYSLRALLTALAPLVGAEAGLGNRAVPEGWAKDAKKEKITEWSTKGAALVDEELRTTFLREYEAEYSEKMRRVSLLFVPVNLCSSYAHHLSDLGSGVPRTKTTRT